MRLPWDEGTVYIGGDCSQLRTGIAWRFIGADGQPRVGTHVLGDISGSSALGPLIERVLAGAPYKRVILAVEYPHWNKNASPVVRAAANTIVRVVKARFKRVRVIKVDPNNWQRTMLQGAPGETTKERSIFVAENALGYVTGNDADRADAACILEYVRRGPDAAAEKTKIARSRNRKKTDGTRER